MQEQIFSPGLPLSEPAPWWREWECAALVGLVLLTYFTRLTAMPVCGEESRWANGACEMIASGDWIVPRQQGTIFPERPPLNSWLMGLAGLVLGDVDLMAVRLPSALATLALTLLIYAYARQGMSRLASFSAAAIYATFGQVLALGRLGESEAVFTLLVAGSLLVWHWGYLRGWLPAAAWSAGYALAALGALAKGPQAPVYFGLATGAYLLLRRDWRWLLARGHVVGLACFAMLVGLWLVPFALSNPEAVDDIWTGLARERFSWAGLVGHVAGYPFETLACLLPWSPLLIVFVKPSMRRWLIGNRPQAVFLITAVAVTYPSVWLAAGARGRYFMPMYPCLAILAALVVERCTAAGAELADRLIWRRYLRATAAAILAGACVLAVLNVVGLPRFAELEQPTLFLVVWLAMAALTSGLLFWASLGETSARPQLAVAALAGFLGLSYCGVIVNVRVNSGNDLSPAIADIKQRLPRDVRLVSFNRVYHRFAYSYGVPIEQIAWPATATDVPSDVEYFCYDLLPFFFDPPDSSSATDPPGATGRLPIEWDRIAEINCDPVKRKDAHSRVVIGRIRRATSPALATDQPALDDSAAQSPTPSTRQSPAPTAGHVPGTPSRAAYR
jgi:4-amino-4-deoxy-L-arabinose transferase-like glycosyltransferase